MKFGALFLVIAPQGVNVINSDMFDLLFQIKL